MDARLTSPTSNKLLSLEVVIDIYIHTHVDTHVGRPPTRQWRLERL